MYFKQYYYVLNASRIIFAFQKISNYFSIYQSSKVFLKLGKSMFLNKNQ
jgi:hypothetical protein